MRLYSDLQECLLVQTAHLYTLLIFIRFMGRRREDKSGVRLEFEGEELQRLNELKRHYSISSNKDLVSMLLKKEYDQVIVVKRGEDSFKAFTDFFRKRPDLLKKMGFQSPGQLLVELIKEYTKTEKPVTFE